MLALHFSCHAPVVFLGQVLRSRPLPKLQPTAPGRQDLDTSTGGIALGDSARFDPAVLRVASPRLQGFGLLASGGLIISVGSSALVVLVVPVGLLAGLLAPWRTFGFFFINVFGFVLGSSWGNPGTHDSDTMIQ